MANGSVSVGSVGHWGDGKHLLLLSSYSSSMI